jgi:hypothetical protein
MRPEPAPPPPGRRPERVRRVRRLPLPGEVLVQAGEEVAPDRPVARIALRPGIPWAIPLAQLLGIPAQDLPAAVLRRPGERVRAREVIARVERGLYGRKEYLSPTDGVVEEVSARSGRLLIREEFGRDEPPVAYDVAAELGCRPRDVPACLRVRVGQEVVRGAVLARRGDGWLGPAARAPVSGVVTAVDPRTGRVTISRPWREVVVRAFLRGRVEEVLPQRGAVVEAVALRQPGVFGAGRETFGLLAPEVGEPGSIAVLPGHAGAAVIERCLQAGVRGLVAGSVRYDDLVRLCGMRPGVGITGQEEGALTVMVTEGFGDLPMHPETWRLLSSLAGREASLSGATQVRAGAVRPELIVPVDGPPDPPGVPDEALAAGRRVRVWSPAAFGAVGRIESLPREPEALESEAVVPVARVRLDSGERLRVARKNLEAL